MLQGGHILRCAREEKEDDDEELGWLSGVTDGPTDSWRDEEVKSKQSDLE